MARDGQQGGNVSGYTDEGVGFTDAETSEEAARSLDAIARDHHRLAILLGLREHPGSTSLENADRLSAQFPGKNFHARTGEMVTWGLLRHGDQKRINRTGKSAAELFLTPAGEARIEELSRKLSS